VLAQPGVEIGHALEIEQSNSCGEGCAYGQGLQALQRQAADHVFLLRD
jgi:hypothetical protein